MKNLLIVSIIAILFSSCARNMYVDLHANKTNTAKIVIKPSMTTRKTFITLNDSLIVNNKIVKSLTLTGIEPGEYKLQYASGNTAYKDQLHEEMNIKVEAGKTITKIVEVPSMSNGYWVYQAACVLVMGSILPTFPVRLVRYR